MKLLSITKQGLLSVALATKNFIINTKLNRNYTRAKYVYLIYDRNFIRKLKLEYYFTTPQNSDVISIRQFQTKDYIFLPKGYDFKLEKSTNGDTEIDILFEDVEIQNNNQFDYIEFNGYNLLPDEDFRKYTIYFKSGNICLIKGFYTYNIKDIEIVFSAKASHDGFSVLHYNDGSMTSKIYNSYFELEEIPNDYVYFPTEITLRKGEYLRFTPNSPVSSSLNFFVGVEYEILE